MSETNVEFHCDQCRHDNRQHMGSPGFEFQQMTFTCFSEAVQHYLDTQHYMTAHVETPNPEYEGEHGETGAPVEPHKET